MRRAEGVVSWGDGDATLVQDWGDGDGVYGANAVGDARHHLTFEWFYDVQERYEDEDDV